MTGYGKASAVIGNRRYTVELRSLNGKQLDLGIRMPSAFREKEMELRKWLGQEVVRGKADLMIQYETEGPDARHELNVVLIGHYLDQLGELAHHRGLRTDTLLDAALRLPDVARSAQEEVTPEEWAQVHALIADAVTQFQAHRAQEGAVLESDFRHRIDLIATTEAGLDALLAARLDRVRARILQHVTENIERGRIDENRFEQEVLFYLEKMDVTEERVRLRAHLAYFIEIMEQGEEQGKKLGFIAQEIGREVNTLGSKANDAEIQRLVVGMKDELEKIKEQVLNVM
ncbi:MAG: hypothetical protein RJA19_732 [Bacteroidota bacterium]|jgi:uncharacterized protein (TIGR00255 family)